MRLYSLDYIERRGADYLAPHPSRPPACGNPWSASGKCLGKAMDNASLHIPFSLPITTSEQTANHLKTDAYNALDKYVVCTMCQGSGVRKIPYNHRFLEETCETCGGDCVAIRSAIEPSFVPFATTDISSFDVIVVGGGLAGLSCARRLIASTPELRIAVVEARQNLGGRTCAQRVLDSDDNVLGIASVGGTWIGQKHSKMLALARDVGLEVEKQYYPRSNDADFSRLISLLSYSLKPLVDNEDEQMNAFIEQLEAIVSTVDISDITKLPNAKVYDSLSIKEFVSSKVKSVAVRYELMTFFESILSCDISECSFLYAIWLIASSGGLEALGDNTPVSNQMYVLQDSAGPSQICSRIAERMKHVGVVFLRATATAIDYSCKDRIVLKTDYFELNCIRCVFAVNPTLAFTTVQFKPKLPLEKRKLCQTFLKGHVIKVYLCYTEPFWGDEMVSTDSTVDDKDIEAKRSDTGEPTEIIKVVNDNNQLAIHQIFPAKNMFYCKNIGGYHAIVALITGKTCESIMDKSREERQELIVQQLQGMYEHVSRDLISKPVAYLEKNWCADDLSGGCFSNGYRSFINVQSALQTPLDNRIFFASSETSNKFCGYMEGAILSGEAVADIIVKSF